MMACNERLFPRHLVLKFQDHHTPLMCAVTKGSVQCVLALLNAGARTDLTDEKGDTPLHVACFNGDHENAQLLSKFTMDLDTYNTNGFSPMQLAAKQGHLKIVRTLLLAGSNPDFPNQNGITPDVMAFAQGHKKVGLLLTRMKPGKVKQWREQLLHETKQLPRIKLKILGSTMVGKTQLTNSLRSGFISAFLRKKLTAVSELTGFSAEQADILEQTQWYPTTYLNDRTPARLIRVQVGTPHYARLD
ncbi:hypothetical protein PHET_01633 [Paragonimus heterotremus]|uniref:Uncharacterized protein n=1 Tax=Paragonimus heterotremus TaxID=100268 RepID=A0A8J4WJ86_9TREM|nr:hypothetical protein PHET_01633 [Paragonimus heterotremus]